MSSSVEQKDSGPASNGMTIALVLNPYAESHPSGPGRMALETSRAILAAAPDTRFLIALKDKPKMKLPFPGSHWEAVVSGGGMWWLDSLMRRTRSADVHLFFTPVLPFFLPKRSVVVVHDFAYRRFPDAGLRGVLSRATLTYIHRRALRRADLVVAVSEATREEAARFARLPQGKIRVIYNGTKDACEG